MADMEFHIIKCSQGELYAKSFAFLRDNGFGRSAKGHFLDHAFSGWMTAAVENGKIVGLAAYSRHPLSDPEPEAPGLTHTLFMAGRELLAKTRLVSRPVHPEYPTPGSIASLSLFSPAKERSDVGGPLLQQLLENMGKDFAQVGFKRRSQPADVLRRAIKPADGKLGRRLHPPSWESIDSNLLIDVKGALEAVKRYNVTSPQARTANEAQPVMA